MHTICSLCSVCDTYLCTQIFCCCPCFLQVVKGGKIMGFRAVVVIGDMKGRVGVGCESGREVQTAVKRALVDARKNIVRVPLVRAGTIPHR